MLFAGCTGEETAPSKTKLTIEPYNISDQEMILVSKTDVMDIEFFELNGTLKEEDDLQFSVEVFEKGKLKEEILKSRGEIQTKFKDTIISFGVGDRNGKNKSLKLINGLPSGLATKYYSNDMTLTSISKLIEGKITLEKNTPIYLAVWLGTKKEELSSGVDSNEEILQAIKDTELVFLYKVLWTDK